MFWFFIVASLHSSLQDISRDARETKLSYTSPDKDGIFIVAATRGADQLESLKTNNILKAKQDEKCELHDRVEDLKKDRLDAEKAKEAVQVRNVLYFYQYNGILYTSGWF